jgi:hypothetical protein
MTDDVKKLILLASLTAVIAGSNAAFANPIPESTLSEKEKEIARKERELDEKIKREENPQISGKIEETMDSGSYTYVLLANGAQKTWVAMPKMKVALGQELVFKCNNEMWNFRSKSLERTFERIYFCNGPEKTIGGADDGSMAGKVSTGSVGPEPAKAEKIKVEKATGADAYTIEELYAKREDLDRKSVAVKGKVVKVSEGIMGKNWIHIQDGSGDPKKKTHNLVVTSQDIPKVGAIVTVNGTLRADKDFGGGYKYAVIVEEAAIK